MFKTFERGNFTGAFLLSVMMLITAMFMAVLNGHAASLEALANQGLSLSNGPLTYSGFTANLSVTPADLGIPSPIPSAPFFYTVVPTIHEVDVTATPTGLHMTGLNIFGLTNGLPRVTLQLSYLVSASSGDVASMTAGVPNNNGSISSEADHRLTATILGGTRLFAEAGNPILCSIAHCNPGPVPLNAPLVMINETVHYLAGGPCRLGPPTRDNVAGCQVNLSFEVSTTFAAVPEPSAWLLFATGLFSLGMLRARRVAQVSLASGRCQPCDVPCSLQKS